MKWEYRVKSLLESEWLIPKNIGELFNTMGGEGWELITIVDSTPCERTAMKVAVFKRPQSN